MAETVRLLAAGSLAPALARIGDDAGCRVTARFGPSGLLRAAIEAGEAWDVFASADVGHSDRIHRLGLGTMPQVFCRNMLALVLRPDLAGDDAEALLRDPRLRLGISTPGNDPSGDYAVATLERLGPGLGARALPLTGAPDLPQPPAGRNAYAWAVTSGAADMMLTYRSNAMGARRDSPALRLLDLPDALQPDITFALTTRTGAVPAAARLADAILSRPVQARFAAFGFLTSLPQPAPHEGGP